VKYIVSRYDDMNAKHRNDGRYKKIDIQLLMDLYLGIRLLGKRFV